MLDNKPFGWAIGSIIRRSADVEVERRLLYLEPDPGEVSVAVPDAPARAAPGTIEAAIGAASGVPRREPILDDLLDVEAHNERVGLIRDVIETNFDLVASILEETLGPLDQLLPSPTSRHWRPGTQPPTPRQSSRPALLTPATYG